MLPKSGSNYDRYYICLWQESTFSVSRKGFSSLAPLATGTRTWAALALTVVFLTRPWWIMQTSPAWRALTFWNAAPSHVSHQPSSKVLYGQPGNWMWAPFIPSLFRGGYFCTIFHLWMLRNCCSDTLFRQHKIPSHITNFCSRSTCRNVLD